MSRASLILVLALCSGCTITPQGKQVWNPFTWFSASELSSKQAADKKADKAADKVEDATAKMFHAAHLEFFKCNLSLIGTPDVDLATRFNRNGLGLLAQVDPLSAAETQELYKLVADLRSGDAKRVAAAEQRQREVEGFNNELSKELEGYKAKLKDAIAAVGRKDAELAKAFVRENELADTLRNQRFIIWGAGIAVVALMALSVYLRMGLGSVGSALHFLPKVIGTENAAKVVNALDTETDWLHQKLVGYGRRKAAAIKAKAESILAD